VFSVRHPLLSPLAEFVDAHHREEQHAEECGQPHESVESDCENCFVHCFCSFVDGLYLVDFHGAKFFCQDQPEHCRGGNILAICAPLKLHLQFFRKAAIQHNGGFLFHGGFSLLVCRWFVDVLLSIYTLLQIKSSEFSKKV
jgi:hypothetical protein